MTRRSKRELERALGDLEGNGGADEVFVITDHVVETPHPAEVKETVRKTRMWHDDLGDWHTEEIDVDEERDCDSEE